MVQLHAEQGSVCSGTLWPQQNDGGTEIRNDPRYLTGKGVFCTGFRDTDMMAPNSHAAETRRGFSFTAKYQIPRGQEYAAAAWLGVNDILTAGQAGRGLGYRFAEQLFQSKCFL